MQRMRYALLVVLLVGCAQALGATFYVAPGGSDENPGTQAAPFATIRRAQEAVRALGAKGLAEDVTVVLGGGTYRLAKPLVFGPQDAGTAQHAVTYAAAEGETVVISGGRVVTGWKRSARDVWTARVPGVAGGTWYPRHLWVGGRRAVRARTPNADGDGPYWQLTGGGVSKDLKTFTITLPPGTVRKWSGLEDTEVVVLKLWSALRKRVAAVDEQTGVVTLRPPHVKGSAGNRARKGMWCWFENSPDFLDVPGEWYLDRAGGVLSYLPHAGENPAKVEVVVPALERLVVVDGTPERPVRNLHFAGIRFAHTDWAPPAPGHDGRQAFFWYGGAEGVTEEQAHPKSAIHWRWAVGCSLTRCEVSRTGATAVRLEAGCSDCRIEAGRLFDVAGNGIMVGVHRDPSAPQRGKSPPATTAPLLPRPELPHHVQVTNNHVRACGATFPGAVGIWVGFARDIRVAHNLVHDMPYTGISIGWKWNTEPTSAARYTVAHNHIYGCMTRLADGGGIYSLGWIPGTVLRGNLIHTMRRSPFACGAPNNGIFFDEGSKAFLVAENVIYETAGQAVRFNRSKKEWHTWRDNVLGTKPDAARLEAIRATAGPGLKRP